MREIKFRAWDKETEKMLMPDSNSDGEHIWQFNGNGDIVILAEGTKWKEGGGETYEETGFYPIDCALMQFTGLLHKNGKEIYEGDIFRQEKETDEGDIRNYLVVFWVKQRAAFYLVDVCHLSILENNDCSDEKEFDWLFQDAALYDFSIDVGLPLVGNIYENPELLK